MACAPISFIDDFVAESSRPHQRRIIHMASIVTINVTFCVTVLTAATCSVESLTASKLSQNDDPCTAERLAAWTPELHVNPLLGYVSKSSRRCTIPVGLMLAARAEAMYPSSLAAFRTQVPVAGGQTGH